MDIGASHPLLLNTTFLEETMDYALTAAQTSLPKDIPIGAVIVDSDSGNIAAQSGNTREKAGDPTTHCEINVIRDVCAQIGDWRLNNYILFSTLEPCVMCAGALVQCRIGAVVYGAHDKQYGALGSRYNFLADPRLSHNAPVISGIQEEACATLLNAFFTSLR